MTKTIFIGDVHGCIEELDGLLRACAHRAEDHVVFVGDLVAKGPDSAAVVNRARALGASAVLGNHDAHTLSCAGLSMREASERGRSHHHEVAQALGPDNLQWLASLPLYLEIPGIARAGADVIVVHGGLMPGIPLAQQTRNDLLNMRSIRADGHASKRLDGAPWASMWPGPAHVIFGHDAVRGLQQHPHATGLDTGCVYGRCLTALVLPEGRLVSEPARRAYRPVE